MTNQSNAYYNLKKILSVVCVAAKGAELLVSHKVTQLQRKLNNFRRLACTLFWEHYLSHFQTLLYYILTYLYTYSFLSLLHAFWNLYILLTNKSTTY